MPTDIDVPTPNPLPYGGPAIYPQAVALSVLAFIALILTIPPLILNIKTRNLATTMLTLSITIFNLQNAINPIIWPNDDLGTWYTGEIFCDIETKATLGISALVPGSATCIARHLALVLSPRRAGIAPSASSKRHRLIFEIVLCIVLPVYIMSVHILVQPARYYIHGIWGCQYSLDPSLMAFLLITLWLTIVSLLGTGYSILIVIRLVRHQQQINTLLSTAKLSKARFARVFALAAIFVLPYTPLIIYSAIWNSSSYTWRWELIHPPDWSQIILKVKTGGVVRIDHWLQVVSGYLVFAVFGLGGDSMVMYRHWMEVLGVAKVWMLFCNTVGKKFGMEGRNSTQMHNATMDVIMLRDLELSNDPDVAVGYITENIDEQRGDELTRG